MNNHTDREELAAALMSANQSTVSAEAMYEQEAAEYAEALITAGYRKVFDGDCGLSNVKDPSDREAAEAWMRWANLAMNDEIGAIGAMKQMLTEFGYRKAEASK
jgi:hypothetical protein